MSAPLRVAGDAEIIVVGAGPAGASCAALLAEWGHDVLLVDQSSFPRDKPCGDGLTQSAVSALRRLDLDALIASSMQVSGMRIFVDHKRFEHRSYDPTPHRPDRARCIRRSVLDDALLGTAIERGARFLEARVTDRAGPPGSLGVQAVIDSEACLLQARFVIAADGATSRLRRMTIRRRLDDALSAYAVRAYFRCEHPVEPVFSTYIPLELEGGGLFGYGWVFPLEEHVVNIGVGYWRWRGVSPPAKLSDVLSSFVGRLRAREGGRFGELEQISTLAGSPLGIQFRRDHCEAEGVVFVGDAARTTDPWSGEGIAYAMHGAELIAKLIHTRARHRGRPVAAGAVLGRRFGRLNYQMSSQLRLLERRLRGAPVSLADRVRYPFLFTLQHAAMAPDEAPTLLETPMGTLARGDAAMSERLALVNELLLDDLETVFPFATEVLHAEIRAGLGPLCTAMLVAFDSSASGDLLLSAASAIELVKASVGPTREIVDRPRDEVGRLNNTLCVLIADLALSRSARRAVRVGGWLARALLAVMKSICRALATESHRLFDPGKAARDYIGTAEAKMAGPLALAARFGALSCEETPDVVAKLDGFGRKLGLAVQIYEDVDELMRGIPVRGRHPGTDLRLGAYPLPILYAAERDQALRELLRGRVAQDDLPAILATVFQTGAMAKTLQLVSECIEEAQHLLTGLDGLCFERLRALAVFTFERTQTLIEGDPAALGTDAYDGSDTILHEQPVAG